MPNVRCQISPTYHQHISQCRCAKQRNSMFVSLLFIFKWSPVEPQVLLLNVFCVNLSNNPVLKFLIYFKK